MWERAGLPLELLSRPPEPTASKWGVMEDFARWIKPLLEPLPNGPHHHEKPLAVFVHYLYETLRCDANPNAKAQQLNGIVFDQERLCLLIAYLDADAHFGKRHAQAKKRCLLYGFPPHFHAHTQVAR